MFSRLNQKSGAKKKKKSVVKKKQKSQNTREIGSQLTVSQQAKLGLLSK